MWWSQTDRLTSKYCNDKIVVTHSLYKFNKWKRVQKIKSNQIRVGYKKTEKNTWCKEKKKNKLICCIIRDKNGFLWWH